MQVHTRTEGGCTGHGRGAGRQAHEARVSPGERARDVTADVAPLFDAALFDAALEVAGEVGT
jgi:hypothetical protein